MSKIYRYRNPQILITSDRLILDSRNDDTILTSALDVHIGAGRNMTISTNEDLIIESRNIYLGKGSYSKVREEASENPPKEKPEPLVLGQQLVTLFKDLIDTLMETHCLTPAGSPVPVMDSTGTVPIKADGPGRKGLETIKGELNKILSSYHYIEANGDPKELVTEKFKEEVEQHEQEQEQAQ